MSSVVQLARSRAN